MFWGDKKIFVKSTSDLLPARLILTGWSAHFHVHLTLITAPPVMHVIPFRRNSHTDSLGMGPLTFHGGSVAAKFCDISSYNKTAASQVNIDRAQVEVNVVLSLESMATSCVVGKYLKFCF